MTQPYVSKILVFNHIKNDHMCSQRNTLLSTLLSLNFCAVDSSRGEWVCWQTGIELRCFDVPVLRIREPQRELNLQRLFNNLRIPQVDYWRPIFLIQGRAIEKRNEQCSEQSPTTLKTGSQRFADWF